MTLCPVALAVGCPKCPVFSFCPLKSVIGDQQKAVGPPASGTSRGTTAGKTPRKGR